MVCKGGVTLKGTLFLRYGAGTGTSSHLPTHDEFVNLGLVYIFNVTTSERLNRCYLAHFNFPFSNHSFEVRVLFVSFPLMIVLDQLQVLVVVDLLPFFFPLLLSFPVVGLRLASSLCHFIYLVDHNV